MPLSPSPLHSLTGSRPPGCTTMREPGHASEAVTSATGNFAFLAVRSPLLAELGATAERVFPFDPASCVVRLRLLAEAITQDIAARLGLDDRVQPTQAELLRAVDGRLGLDAQVCQLFHLLRVEGNRGHHRPYVGDAVLTDAPFRWLDMNSHRGGAAGVGSRCDPGSPHPGDGFAALANRFPVVVVLQQIALARPWRE